MVALGTRDGHYIGVGRNNITDKEYLILKSRVTQGRLNYYNGLSQDEKPRESIENYDVANVHGSVMLMKANNLHGPKPIETLTRIAALASLLALPYTTKKSLHWRDLKRSALKPI